MVKLTPLEPSRAMVEDGAQRLVSWEDGCVWPDSWDALQVIAARNDAERVWRSMWLATPSHELSNVERDVLAERQRQIDVEGWTPEHDDEHELGELAIAASCYALQSTQNYEDCEWDIPDEWPWDPEWWKPKNPLRDLERAAALLLAEIERRRRGPFSQVGSETRGIDWTPRSLAV